MGSLYGDSPMETYGLAANFLARYARAVDSKNVAGIIRFYDRDATFSDGVVELSGKGEISEWFTSRLTPGSRSQHAISNLEVNEQDGGLRLNCYVSTTVVGAASLFAMGTYEITARPHGGSLMIQRKVVSTHAKVDL